MAWESRCLSIYPSVNLSVRLFIYLSIFSSIHPVMYQVNLILDIFYHYTLLFPHSPQTLAVVNCCIMPIKVTCDITHLLYDKRTHPRDMQLCVSYNCKTYFIFFDLLLFLFLLLLCISVTLQMNRKKKRSVGELIHIAPYKVDSQALISRYSGLACTDRLLEILMLWMEQSSKQTYCKVNSRDWKCRVFIV